MQIQISTDHNIEGSHALTDHVREVVTSTLGHVRSHVTGIEVHLGDEIGQKAKTGGDKRCVMEARLQGHQPVAVTSHAPSLHQAVDSAANKLLRAIESDLGRLHDHRPHGAGMAQDEPLQ